MIPGMNPRQMQKAMKRMGIQQEDLPAVEVIIKLSDRQLVFSQPAVAKVNMMGQETYQVVGTPEELPLETTPEINEDDIQTVVDQTGVSEEKAKEALEEAEGDIAAAILALKEED